MTEPTAGPWRINNDATASRNDGLVVISNRCGLPVCSACSGDADLIAAAPDLLAACKALKFGKVPCGTRDTRNSRDGYDCGKEGRLCPHCQQAQAVAAAIARAEGR